MWILVIEGEHVVPLVFDEKDKEVILKVLETVIQAVVFNYECIEVEYSRSVP